MSTVYNRRRGASARRARKPRQCVHHAVTYDGTGNEFEGERCIRLARVNRYCAEHQRCR